MTVADLELKPGDRGAVVIRRLHRLVRHGYRPWLGYDVAGGQDREIHLRRKDGLVVILPDGSVAIPVAAMPGALRPNGRDGAEARTIIVAGDDDAGFDACFPANTPNKRDIMRRLYEIGFLARL